MSDEEKNAIALGERRSSQRIAVEMWVEESTDRELYFQRGANISLGGIFLERTIPHPKGTMVNLQFTLPDESEPIRVKGEIVNVGEASSELGMGIKFVDLSADDQKRIQDFIRRASQKKS
jgi:uncharacterized protein (TIGR02266 family)